MEPLVPASTVKGFRRVARVLCVLACALSVIVLVGWTAGARILTTGPAATPVNPLTAIAILLAAFSTLAQSSPGLRARRPQLQKFSAAAAWAVALVGLITVVGYLAGRNLGLDQVLFGSQLEGNRIAPNTGLNFLLVGLVLVLMDRPRREGVAQAIVLIPISLSMVSLIGYVFGAAEFTGLTQYIPMALPTTVMFLCLGFAIQLVRPDRGVMGIFTNPHAGGQAARRLLPIAVLLPLVITWFRVEGQRRGFYSLEFGSAMIAVVQVGVFCTIILFMAYKQNIADRDLRRARDLAEAGNRAKAAFLANMSHEIRTPLNAVLGMSQLLQHTELDREQREYAETISLSGTHLLTIINDILDFSKIESGALHLQHRAFHLPTVVEESLDLIATRAGEKGLELTYYIAPQVPDWLIGDAARLRQVLLNLLSNAVKFTDRGEIAVSVEVQEEDPIEPLVLFKVKDTGVGIRKEELDKLFRSFSQLDSTATRSYGGTGLGLAITRQLSGLMGGGAGVESEHGKGSTFFFTVRLPRSVAPPQKQTAEGVLRGVHALVVDDNETNRRLLQVLADRWGMVTREATNPDDALKLLQGPDPFDVLLLDYVLPDSDGIALAREIRRLPQRAKTPMLLLSSVGHRPDLDPEDQALFRDVLPKPIRQSQLLDAVQDALAQGAAPRTGRVNAVVPRAVAADRLKILLVEDNPVNRRVALRMLEKIGVSADTATNGLEGIEKLEQNHYDLVFMDIQMPVLDGLEAARRICRRWARAERPRLIAMTAEAMLGDRERCLEAGFDDYVAKPVSLDALRNALNVAAQPTSNGDAPGPMPSTNGATALDQNVLQRLQQDVGGGAAIVPLIESYVNEGTQLLDDLTRALTARDAAEARRASHTLKSTSLTFGALQVGELAKECEALCKEGKLPDVADRLARLRELFSVAREKLEAYAKAAS